MIDPYETLRRIEHATVYKANWDRRYRRLGHAYYGFRWTGLGWEAFGVSWAVWGMLREYPLAVIGTRWLGCVGLALLHSYICKALLCAQERMLDELQRASLEIAAYLGSEGK